VITIARILNAYRDAEQFELPTEGRSRIWHLLIYPQYAFSIFAIPVYFIISWNWIPVLLGLDIGLSWAAFEIFLPYFRKKFKEKA